MIQKNSEDLILRIQQSERIREEQTKIIERLLSEYNFMINKLRRNPNIETEEKQEEKKEDITNNKKEEEISSENKEKKEEKEIII